MAPGLQLVRDARLRLRRQPLLLLLPAAGLVVAAIVLVGTLIGPGRAVTATGRGGIAAVHKQHSATGSTSSSPNAAVRASPPARRPSPPPATALPAAILATHNGPFASSTFEVRNAWHGASGSDVIWVYAGTAMTPGGTRTLTAPGVRVYLQMHDGAEPYSVFQGSYAAPGADSALTITGFTGTVLTLRTDGGEVYRFDVVARRFL